MLRPLPRLYGSTTEGIEQPIEGAKGKGKKTCKCVGNLSIIGKKKCIVNWDAKALLASIHALAVEYYSVKVQSVLPKKMDKVQSGSFFFGLWCTVCLGVPWITGAWDNLEYWMTIPFFWTYLKTRSAVGGLYMLFEFYQHVIPYEEICPASNFVTSEQALSNFFSNGNLPILHC